MVDLTQENGIYILTMNEGPNLVCPAFLEAMNNALDVIETASSGALGLVLTGEGKFFCNGINVPVMSSLVGEELQAFWTGMSQLVKRLLVAPYPVVAAVNGHAFAAGAVFALACDYRVMRADRGWICFSEVDAGVPIPASTMAMIRAKLPPNTARDAVIAGKRYTADEAISAGFADNKATEEELVALAVKYASELGGADRPIFGELKRTLWINVAEAMAVGA